MTAGGGSPTDGPHGGTPAVSVWSRLARSRFGRWAVSTRPAYYRVFHCPACGREIRRRVGAPNPGAMGAATGLSERELTARCPTDGHPPWNTPNMHRIEGIEVGEPPPVAGSPC